jgi:hypothetical protein
MSLNLFCNRVAAGSSITAALTLPCSIAAIAVAPRPMPTTPTEFGSTPFLESRYFRKKSVDEPGAETPTLLPARSLIDLMSLPDSGEAASTIPGKRS